jgi:hypothetical protein
MLQRSLSTSSLVKQAAAAVQAQQTLAPSKRPALGRSSAYLPSASLMVPSSRDQLDFLDLGCFSPRPSSGDRSPFDYHKRHIRFDEKVEQCIAVEANKDDDFDAESSEDDGQNNDDSDSDSSDDGIVMMRRPKRKRAVRKPLSRSSSSSRTIEKLPSTTLKNQTDNIEPPPQPASSMVRSWSSSKLPQSASQETIKPSNPSKNYILSSDAAESDELDSEDTESLRDGAFANRRDSVAVHRSRASGSPSTSPSEDETCGMRRSASGMFMPYEEDEDDIVAAGLFGKVSDTINTAKDIAHVIWNVGWRK